MDKRAAAIESIRRFAAWKFGWSVKEFREALALYGTTEDEMSEVQYSEIRGGLIELAGFKAWKGKQKAAVHPDACPDRSRIA